MEPFKTSTRFVIQRRWPKAKHYDARHWHNCDYQPDGRVSHFVPAVFRDLDDAKKAIKKLRKWYGDTEYRLVNEVRTYAIVED